jgi:hypothetical protein
LLWTAMTAGLIYHGESIERYLPRLRYPGEVPTGQAAQPVAGERR